MSMELVNCPVCGTQSEKDSSDALKLFFVCPICGKFELSRADEEDGICAFNKNHLIWYLIYHSYKREVDDYRYNSIMSQEECDRYKEEFHKGQNICGLPVHMDPGIVDIWYPKTLSEKVDRVLLYLFDHIKHMGQGCRMNKLELVGILFGDPYEVNKIGDSGKYKFDKRNLDIVFEECRFLLDYMKQIQLISWGTAVDAFAAKILPAWYSRIDDIQKYSNTGRNVLVAMQFGDKTKLLREKIRQGISDAGYHAVFIDEVQHNDYITPELLKYIKDSKFVVVDLTHKNNGAYFEEGYAMGLGKTVIQLCKSRVRLHFDIAQKNTIMWNEEEDIPELLKKRITATID